MSKKLTRVKYSKLVPEDSFLGRYLQYMDIQETPYAFDFWTGCFLLSVITGRGICVNRPRAPVYLNLYALFVAESGTTRKSTAIRFAVDFARPFCNEQLELIESKTTPEKLEHQLHVQSKRFQTSGAIIAISELVTFLGREKYNEGMPTLLTDLYDSPAIRSGGGTLASGTRVLQNVYVSFLSASTPAWLLRAVNPDVIEGGFTSRIMFIVADKPKRLQPWPEDGNEQLREQIEVDLQGIRLKCQNITKIEISDGGRKSFDKWYRSRHISSDPFRSSFQSREDAHILRLAAFLAINDNTWVIQHTHIINAIKVITEVREDGASIFAGTGSSSRTVLGLDKIRDKLLAAGSSGVKQTELTKAVSNLIPADVMKNALEIMLELQMVQKFENIQVGKGRPLTIWRATSALTQSKALDKIINAHGPSKV